MKSIVPSVLAIIGLAFAPVAAQADEVDAVSYDDAMKCSALFTVLGTGADGTDKAELEDMATRWLVVAMNRDGTEDGSKALNGHDPMVDAMINALEEFGEKDETEGEEFLTKGIEFCEGKHAEIADEIDTIEIE